MNAPAAHGSSAALGWPRLHLHSTDSTNERARELAIAGAPAGTLVTAGEQSAGRGRQGRRWSAPAGSSILMSLVLRDPPPLLPLAAAVAVCDVAGEQAMIKWPNDVVLMTPAAGPEEAPAKLAGILVEGRPQQGWAVLGIGLNVAVRLEDLPPELRPGARGAPDGTRPRPAASMGRDPKEVEPVLAGLLLALARRLGEPASETLNAWRPRDALKGRRISWNGGHGRADGIDGNGRLVVALDEGGQTVLGAGEVHLESIGAAPRPRD
jgi:BirA family biotin operon repressor/biotin-[acetyl-CoA-carboxylase] ligase